MIRWHTPKNLNAMTDNQARGPGETNVELSRMDQKVPDLEPASAPEAQDIVYDVIKESPHTLVMKTGETVVNALRRLQAQDKSKDAQQLLTSFKGDTGCCTRYTILEGELGCCTYYGRTHFLTPGNYLRIGWGCTLHQVIDQENRGAPGTQMRWKDLAYVSLAENQAAVIQEGDRQLVIASGRYIFRAPTVLHGVVDTHSLKTKVTSEAITEEAGETTIGHTGRMETKDKVVIKRLDAGSWEKIGAVTFLRSSPGFCYVIQNPSGKLRAGIGFNVCRGGELLVSFIDRQNYARTTRTFILESKDRQEVQTRVQLRWRLVDACLWTERKGASTDIFDAIEEILQALLRDAIAAHTYEQCTEQAGEGYEGIENMIRGPLSDATQELGGLLLGFEIRELRFPLLEKRNASRAEQEAKQAEQLLEMKKKAAIEEQTRTNMTATMLHDREETAKRLEHENKMQILTQEKEKSIAEARQALNLIELDNKSKANLITIQTKQAESQGEADRKLVIAKSLAMEKLAVAEAEAKAKLATAQAEAESRIRLAEADAQSRIRLAEADAKAAELVGAAYRANQDYLRLEISRLNADVLKARALAISTAMTHNKGAMMPQEMQRELAILDAGFSPIAPILLPGTSIVSQK